MNSAPYEPLFAAAGEPVHLDSTEAKFQISFKSRLWTTDDRRWGAWVGYTQQNQWQVYNDDISRPFRRDSTTCPRCSSAIARESSFRAGSSGGSSMRVTTTSPMAAPIAVSRSWDRLFAEFGVEKENLALFAKVWYRLPESADKDDNPDITDYYGHGELSALYRWRGNSFSVLLRGNLNTGKGAVQLGWMSPPLPRRVSRLRAVLFRLR